MLFQYCGVCFRLCILLLVLYHCFRVFACFCSLFAFSFHGISVLLPSQLVLFVQFCYRFLAAVDISLFHVALLFFHFMLICSLVAPYLHSIVSIMSLCWGFAYVLSILQAALAAGALQMLYDLFCMLAIGALQMLLICLHAALAIGALQMRIDLFACCFCHRGFADAY